MRNHNNTNELYHWKYVKRERVDGKWRYWYDDQKSKVTAKTAKIADKATESVLKTANDAPKKVNLVVNEAKKAIDKVYDDPDNIYDITPKSYEEKVAKVKETPEWKEIVERSDPEYVKKTADGGTKYLVDDYIVDKKHPVLDAVGDIVEGREITINEITKDTVVANLKEQAFGVISMGMLAATTVSKLMTEKYKLQQGTYNEQIAQLTEVANAGAKYVADTTITTSDVEKLAKTLEASTQVEQVANAINEDKVVEAAKLIVESETVRNAANNSDYYKLAESTLSNLSEEEIMAINLLIKEMRKG